MMSTNMQPLTVCLASASAQRLALLQQLGLQCDVLPMNIDETRKDGELAEKYVLRLAQSKARGAFERVSSDTVVIGADTTVSLDDEIFEKPTNSCEAARMLEKLSGNTHRVYTGAGIVTKHGEKSIITETLVTFKSLSQNDIKGYIETQEPFGKAGAYAIQGRAAAFVERIQGSYSNVVGLPLFETAQMLAEAGVDVMNLNQS